MTDILKIAAVAISASLCAVVVKKQVRELGLVLALTAGAVILAAALEALQSVRELLDELAQTAGLEPAVLAPVVKTVGVAIITRVTVEVCKDAGEGGIAAFVEIAGSAAALYLALPLVRAVLSAITGLL
ncbi:SpoIIIAC/SpoIIIAD family protein [Pseudoflavonifractor sp.]|jgi:stage III sporulation protein AD|uniref:SpoIIIAC/SpoIIIAD family protein n=1 Tax=Pseudoflavonifractor sp. TaxID=1980281 RepID=UPI003D8A9C78